jgi:hypothetical protein
LKFDLEVTETRVSATSTFSLEGAEIRINLNVPWETIGFSVTPQVKEPVVQTTLALVTDNQEISANG